MAKQVWGKHSTVATGTNVGSKQVSVDVWNESLNRKGLLGFDSETIASESEITIPADTSSDSSDGSTSSFIKLSGVADVDKFIVTNTSDGDLLYIITTGSATLVNVTSPSTGEIRLLANDDKDLSTTVPTVLMRVGNSWYEYGGEINTAHTVDAGDLTGTTLASGVVTSSITALGTIVTGAWESTDVAVAHGGTGSSTASAARTALGVAIGSDVQIYNSATALTSNKLSDFAATSSSELAGIITGETGSGALVFGTSPTLSTPALGTPSALVGTSITGTATGFTAGNATLAAGLSATLAVGSGGTGSTTASGARTALGVAPAAGDSNILTVGILNSGSINTAFGNIDNGTSTLDTGDITATAVDVAGGDVDNVQNLIHDISVTGLDIDFDEDQLQTYAMAGNITFTSVNEATGKSKTIKITTDGSERTFTAFPDWHWVGTEPTVQAASKVGILTLTCFGTGDTDVIAAYAVEA